MHTQDTQIAKSLLEIGAVKLNVNNPFVWVSGIKSPIYCDNRIINSKVDVRTSVITAFCDLIKKEYLDKIDIIAAVATGGIPYGILIADKLGLPFIYVREERKQHGLMKSIEGDFKDGDRILLIEDHISTGKSSLKAITTLREENLNLVALLSIMTYGFKKAEDSFKTENVQYQSLCNLDSIIEVALLDSKISPDDADTILKFRETPEKWNQ